MSIRDRIPWWARVLAKLLLSRMPLRYRFWRRFNLFIHGLMDRPEYAYRVITSHMNRLDWRTLEDKVVLELGPGDSLFTAVIASALGARQCYIVDVGAYAGERVAPYRACAAYLRENGLQPPALDDCMSVSAVLRTCNAVYLTHGVEDLRRIPSGSVDWVFSQAVLEHVPLGEFGATACEMRRVLSPAGAMSHRIDLKDHLGGALNNLRFSSRVWESHFMASSGFYTNRLRFSQIVHAFKEAGFDVRVVDVMRWAQLPTPRRRLAPSFRALSDDELLVRHFDVVGRPTEDNAGIPGEIPHRAPVPKLLA